jgi:hypothetical protein
MDHDREISGFEPQYLQFLTPMKGFGGEFD